MLPFFALQHYGVTLMVDHVLNPFQMLLLFYGTILCWALRTSWGHLRPFDGLQIPHQKAGLHLWSVRASVIQLVLLAETPELGRRHILVHGFLLR